MPIILKNITPSGEHLEATFLPEKGMNMISYKKDDVEVIDLSTKQQFEERFAGLGALIGPHFHHKRQRTIISEEIKAKFPHIANLKGNQTADYFSHGIGRYAPWKAEATGASIKASLSGKDLWNDVPLSILEGQNFKMDYFVNLTPEGLDISLSVVSETASIIGIHFYYYLPEGSGKVIANVKREFIGVDHSERKPIPADWNYSNQNTLTFDLKQEADYTFYPFPNPLQGKILLDAGSYRLQTTYRSPSEENSWQLYHPKDSSFVCIEPVSSQDPRHTNLTVSTIQINLKIMDGAHV